MDSERVYLDEFGCKHARKKTSSLLFHHSIQFFMPSVILPDGWLRSSSASLQLTDSGLHSAYTYSGVVAYIGSVTGCRAEVSYGNYGICVTRKCGWATEGGFEKLDAWLFGTSCRIVAPEQNFN